MKTGLIVCGALGREVKEIVSRLGWDAGVFGVSPMDHMFPQRIAPDVEKRILKIQSRCDHIVAVYGECGTRGTLDTVLKKHEVPRIDVQNCYEMYAGETYHQLIEEVRGTFFLTDYLVRTFHQAVIKGLGLDRYPQLKNEYFHNLKRVAYLVQTENPELLQKAQSIAAYFELPLHIHHTGSDGLEQKLWEAVNREEYKKGMPGYKTTCYGRSTMYEL